MPKPYLLITGANGLVGQKLVANLIAKNSYKVFATGKGKSRLPKEWCNYEYIEMDITDYGQVEKVYSEIKPAVTIHCACMTDVDLCETERTSCYKQNVEGVKSLIKACKETGSHFIFISTDFIFDGENGPYTENDLPNPINYYGQTKLESEDLTKKSDLKWTIVRTGLVYGVSHDMSRSNIVLWVKNSLESGRPLNMVDDQYRTPTLAEDLAQACILIAEKGATGVFNISGPEYLTPYDMAILIATFFNLDIEKIRKSDSMTFTQTAKRPLKTGFVIDKAVHELGYCPHSFKEGISIISKQSVEEACLNT